MKKVVLTGGTCAGKTTLLQALHDQNYLVIPETGTITISGLNEFLGVQEQQKFRQQYPEAFYAMILRKQAELERLVEEQRQMIKPSSPVIVCDRGIYDYAVMYALQTGSPQEKLFSYMQENNPSFVWPVYNYAIACELLDTFDERKDSGRLFDRESSMQLYQSTRDHYLGLGVPITTFCASQSMQSRLDKLTTLLENV